MHLARPNFLHQGPGVWGDKSQVLFVNDKAIISLVLHRGKKKSYSKDSNKDPVGDDGTRWLEKFFFFFFASQAQTNGPLRVMEELRQVADELAGRQLPHKCSMTQGGKTGKS